jgi:hypothetical protein
MALGSTQPLIEMSIRNLPGGTGRPACKSANLSASVSQFSRKCGNLDVSQSYGPPRPFIMIALPFSLFSDNPRLCSSVNARKDVSQPDRTASTIIDLI